MKYLLFIIVCIQCYITNKVNFPMYNNLFINGIYFIGLLLFTMGVFYISKNFVYYLKKEKTSKNNCFCVIFIIFFITLTYNFFNNWAYYFFDIITKLAPVIAAFGAYYMWSRNREKEIKELEYKQDYYKKIIDKRIETYEQVSNLKRMLEAGIPYNNSYAPCCFCSEKEVEKFKELFDIVVNNRMWLSIEMQECIKDLDSIRIKFLEEICMGKLSRDKYTDEMYADIAVKYFEDINSCRKQITNVLEKDWEDLYDVKKFFKSINKNLST